MIKTWWKESVVYQIYPRSFNDSNGDGIGDLRGIIDKLDYLHDLGINVVWLSPIYQSPQDDNGYDISDYRAIAPEFGTMDDFDEMLEQMHRRGIRLMMDLVVNHTSDEHPWFIEACKGRDNPFRDFYIWRDAKPDGTEPNNWASRFHGSAWEWHAPTGQYYLHLYSKKQPDLNWENPRVRAEVYDLMHFWLKKGVDGFRMDVINVISKVPGLPDVQPQNGDRYQYGRENYINGPCLMEYLAEMKEQVLSHYDLITVGEAPATTPEWGLKLTHGEQGPLNMLFQFQHVDIDRANGAQSTRWTVRQWDLADLKSTISRWQDALNEHGWNSLYLCNHDQPRSVSRFGDDQQYRTESATMLATFLHFLCGTPYVYQGEELGMTNVAFDSIDDYRDIDTLNIYREMVQQRGQSPEQALGLIHRKSRDNARTPMQWDRTVNAGFTKGTPWIGVNPNYWDINAEQERAFHGSVFNFYKRLIALRKSSDVVKYGVYRLLEADNPDIYAYTRNWQGKTLLVVCNFAKHSAVVDLREVAQMGSLELVLNNQETPPLLQATLLHMREFQACVFHIADRQSGIQ